MLVMQGLNPVASGVLHTLNEVSMHTALYKPHYHTKYDCSTVERNIKLIIINPPIHQFTEQIRVSILLIIFDIFSYFSFKPYVVTPHLNGLIETVQMRGHNICFYAAVTKIIPNYH